MLELIAFILIICFFDLIIRILYHYRGVKNSDYDIVKNAIKSQKCKECDSKNIKITLSPETQNTRFAAEFMCWDCRLDVFTIVVNKEKQEELLKLNKE